MVNPETYPGTNVFVNLLGISDPSKFSLVEGVETTTRLYEFHLDPNQFCPIGDEFSFQLSHLRSIHRHLFQNLYVWAGEIRSYEMRIEFSDIFTPPEKIEDVFETVVAAEIKSDDFLRNKPRDFIVEKLARYLGLINMIHPFPDGNGRAQRAFLWQLADRTGYELDWENVPKWEHRITAQRVHREGDYSAMERMIDRILIKRPGL